MLIKKKKRNKEELWGFALAFIPVAGFIIFRLVPMLVALLMAFMRMDDFLIFNATFTGLDNFRIIFADRMFWQSIFNTLYIALSLPLTIIIALMAAILINQKIRFKNVFKTVFYLPFVCSMVAVTIMWRWLFEYNYGVFNQFLGLDINWAGDPKYYRLGIIIMTVWSSIGYRIILLTAALTNVNNNYYEAADIDGAGSLRKFWHITLPAITPTLFFLVVIGLIGAFQEFTRSHAWDSTGGPNGMGITMVFYLYRSAFSYFRMGEASAVSWILSFIILIFTIFNFKLSKLWVHYD